MSLNAYVVDMAANRSSPALVVPPVGDGRERSNGIQVKSASISGMPADVGYSDTTIPASNRSLAREPYRIRINAQNNGFSSERERLILMRSISHLRKEENSTNQQKGTPSAPQIQMAEEIDEQSARPFHHSELASPPCYSNNRSGFSRLSLDIRRSRAMSASDTNPYGEPPHSGNSSSNERRWFSRSQYDLSTHTTCQREAGDTSPTSPRFTPQGTLTDGVLQARARVAAIASAKLRRFSFANLPKMSSKKQGIVLVNKEKEILRHSVKAEKQRAMPTEEDSSVTGIEVQDIGTRIATHDANSDDSISALTPTDLAESGVRFARPNENDFRRYSNAPSSFNSTEPSTNSEDGESSMQSSMNPSRRNSDFQLPTTNLIIQKAPEAFSQTSTISNRNDECELEEDDGIQWATPSESMQNSINPFDKKMQTRNTDLRE